MDSRGRAALHSSPRRKQQLMDMRSLARARPTTTAIGTGAPGTRYRNSGTILVTMSPQPRRPGRPISTSSSRPTMAQCPTALPRWRTSWRYTDIGTLTDLTGLLTRKCEVVGIGAEYPPYCEHRVRFAAPFLSGCSPFRGNAPENHFCTPGSLGSSAEFFMDRSARKASDQSEVFLSDLLIV